MRLLARALATVWGGGLGLTALWVTTPLVGAASLPVEEAGAPGGGAAPTELADEASPDRYAPQAPAGALPPAAGWRTAGEADLALAVIPPAEWLPPAWFPPGEQILVLGALDAAGPSIGPSVRSRSAVVVDIDSGEVLYEKNADTPRPVASLTKMVAALALASAESDLDREFCIGPEQYPTRSGARSRLSTGDCLTGWDVLGAALVASDNRAALGMAAAADMHLEEFVGRMNRVSTELGMTRSSWADPSGLDDENLSTARDLAKATIAVASHPVLSPVASAPHWDIWRSNRTTARRLFTTDRMAAREDLQVEAAKTGYTDTAGYCFTTVLRTESGRHLAVTLLGADGKLTRWADMGRILSWVERS